MNIMIGNQWINLDNVQLIGVFDSRISFTFGRDEVITIPITGAGAKSAWAWLQKAAIVFDETTDAELEPESVEPDNHQIRTVNFEYARKHQKSTYETNDRVIVDTGMDYDTATIAVVSEVNGYNFYSVQRSDGGMAYDIRQSDIIGLAPESVDHE